MRIFQYSFPVVPLILSFTEGPRQVSLMRLDVNTPREFWGLLFHKLGADQQPVQCNGTIQGALLEAIPGQDKAAGFEVNTGDFKVMVDNSSLTDSSTATEGESDPSEKEDGNSTLTTIKIILGDSTSSDDNASGISTLTKIAVIPKLADLKSIFSRAAGIPLKKQQDHLEFVNLAVQELTGEGSTDATDGVVDKTSPGIVAFRKLFADNAAAIRKRTACNFKEGESCDQESTGAGEAEGGGEIEEGIDGTIIQ